jgi:hypothetical protein
MRCLLLSSVLAVAAGAACSDTDTPAREGAGTATLTTVPDVDACVLVDASDAASVLGSPAVVDATPAGGFGETSSCAWITDSDALLVVTVFEGRMFYGGSAGLPGAEDLEVGDEGYIGVDPTFGGVDLQVVKGEWVLGLSAAPFGVGDVEGLPASMTRVAQQAVDRLP